MGHITEVGHAHCFVLEMGSFKFLSCVFWGRQKKKIKFLQLHQYKLTTLEDAK